MKQSIKQVSVMILAGGLLCAGIAMADSNYPIQRVATNAHDRDITIAIKDKLKYAGSKGQFQGQNRISVSTSYSIVTLSGCVFSLPDQMKAEDIVKHTEDVTGLVDELQVKTDCGA